MKVKNQLFLVSFLLIFILFSFSYISFSQGSWTSNPFDQKVFIENKGQFPKDVLFSASRSGLELDFTATGLTYKHDQQVPMTENEKEAAARNGTEEAEEMGERTMKSVPLYFSLEWVGSNTNIKVIPEESVSFYYTYAANNAAPTIKAYACRKIIYKNLYPNIDVEYIFPKDSGGIKYSIILHPGADASLIKMKYSGAKKITFTANKDIEIITPFGSFIDHAPQTFHAGDHKTIPSSFTIKNNIVSFSLTPPLSSGREEGDEIIIDPWVTDPSTFPGWSGYNAMYDINYDLAGNVYAYGSHAPFKLVKLNSGGAIQWVFNATGFGFADPPNGIYSYGDFAVDEASGTSYLAEGTNSFGPSSPCRIFKINTSGVQTGTFPGNPGITEIWRAEYNHCINKIIVAGSAGGGNSNWPSAEQAGILDTGLTSLNPVNVLGAPANEVSHDMSLLAIDNNTNFCYMGTNRAYASPANFDNVILKCPIPALAPTGFAVPDGHKLLELRSVVYVPMKFGSSWSNGMNGMAVSPNFLYTYDSDSLKRWDKNTGAFVAGRHVSAAAPSIIVYPPGPAIQVLWGGISTDECDNIYVGSAKTIKKYNTSLTVTGTLSLPDTVFDVKVGPNNKLYACGKNFVAQFENIANPTMTVTTTQTPAAGCNSCDGTATSTISGGCNPGSFTYNWMPGGQTTQTATGLCPGQYTVTLNSNCSVYFTDTVTVTGGSILSMTVSATPGGCNSTGSASVTVTGGSGPYTYSWNPGAQTNSTATGLTPGTYSIQATDATGCTKTQTVSISSAGNITAQAGPNSTICAGQTVSLSASGGNSYNWGGGNTSTALTVSPTITTTYSVIVSSGVCADTAYATVMITNLPPPIITGNTSLCTGDVATLTASGGNTYSWSTGETTSVINVNPTSSSVSYSVIATSASGCTNSTTVNVTVSPPPVANATSSTICSGQTATLNASGGGTYAWSNGASTSSVNVSPSTNASYSVIVSVGSCADTAYATVDVNPTPTITISGNTTLCRGDISTLTATGGTNYAWNNGNTNAVVNVSPSTTTVYSVVSTNANCSSTASVTVIVSPPPVANSLPATICSGQNSTLTASGGGTYSWSTGQTDNLIIVSPTTNTSYSVVVTVGSCKDTANTAVTVNPVPVAVAWSDTTITAGNNVTLSASGGGTYLWTNGLTDSLIAVAPHVTTIYCVTVDNRNCSDTACVTVFVEPINCSLAANEDAFVLPSAFSPNGDGQNDRWKLLYIPLLTDCISEFQVLVYNRWGEKVFEGTDINFNWDGTYKGKPEDAAVFGYYLTGTLIDGTKIKKKGNISLLR